MEGVDQLALPYRIGLGALLVVAALWFTVLKPGPVEARAGPAAPGVTGLGNAVEGRQGAVATANAAGEAAAPTRPPPPRERPAGGKPAVAQPAPRQARAAQDASDEAAPVLRELTGPKVVVLALPRPRLGRPRGAQRCARCPATAAASWSRRLRSTRWGTTRRSPAG